MSEVNKIEYIDLKTASNREELIKSIIDLSILNFSSPSTNENFTEYLSDENYILRVLLNEGQLIGYIIAKKIFDEAEIYEIAISPNFQNQGHGSHLLKKLIEELFNSEINSILLEVRENNTNAINLYEKYNFKTYLVRKNYYGNINALCMKLERSEYEY